LTLEQASLPDWAAYEERRRLDFAREHAWAVDLAAELNLDFRDELMPFLLILQRLALDGTEGILPFDNSRWRTPDEARRYAQRMAEQMQLLAEIGYLSEIEDMTARVRYLRFLIRRAYPELLRQQISRACCYPRRRPLCRACRASGQILDLLKKISAAAYRYEAGLPLYAWPRHCQCSHGRRSHVSILGGAKGCLECSCKAFNRNPRPRPVKAGS
jgi:hypothetical protein